MWVELDPVSSGSCWRQDGTGTEVYGSTLALERQSQDRTRVERLVKAIYTMYKMVNQSAHWQRPRWAQAPRPGAGAPEGKGGRSRPSSVPAGKGRKCTWRLQIQKRGENSLNNGTKLRLSPEGPHGPRAREWPQCSLCSGLGAALAAAFLSFTIPRELHHIVLLLLLLFR